MSCVTSDNVVCKHVRADKLYYVDLHNQIPPDLTIISASAESDDPLLVIGGVQILPNDLIVGEDELCGAIQLYRLRAILIELAGGTVSEMGDETIVTVEWTTSDGYSDARELRLIIDGDP